MATRVTDREQIRRLLDTGAQLIEVLPRHEYDLEHIAGAGHIWLRDLDADAPGGSTGTPRSSSTATTRCFET